MKRNIAFLVLLFLSPISSLQAEQKDALCKPNTENFRLVPGSVKLQWTAFKTTEKLGVSGTFHRILVEAPVGAKTREAVLKDISFSIDAMSVHSGNPERDKSLQEAFFGLLSPNKNIEGDVLKVENGKALVDLRLNGQQFPVELDYTIDAAENTVKAKGTLDMLGIGLQKSFNAIHERCKLLHTGVDGISKTWTDVDLQLEARIAATCK